MVSGSGISWAMCKSASRTRQITMPAPHHSVFYRPDALPATQPTASKHWRLTSRLVGKVKTHGRNPNQSYLGSVLSVCTMYQLSINICCRCPCSAANQQHTAATVDWWERWTDIQTHTWPLDRPFSICHAGNVNNLHSILCVIYSKQSRWRTIECIRAGISRYHWVVRWLQEFSS